MSKAKLVVNLVGIYPVSTIAASVLLCFLITRALCLVRSQL